MSLLMRVTRCAWAVHRLASSNKETTAASVASCSACKAALWNLKSVSKFNYLSIMRTMLSAKCTLAVEGSFLHQQISRALVSLDFSECGLAWSWSSFLLNSSFNGGTLPSNFLGGELLLAVNFLGVLLGRLRSNHSACINNYSLKEIKSYK